jgi:hypothetical protein
MIQAKVSERKPMFRRPMVANVFAALVAFTAIPAVAMETEVKIDQNKALAGGVTPGDAPGFPITLTQPGRYVLTSNLYPPPDTGGIEIKNHDITVDFNGFRLHGLGEATFGIRNPDLSTPWNNVSVMNGVIAGFKWEAISSGNGDFWTVENMRVLSNGGGVNVHNWARVQSNTIGFSDINVFCFEGCLVADNNISNGRIGINITSGTIVRNSIINHVLHGISGTSASAGGAVGYGENTLVGNNQGGAQVRNATALNPNFCSPMC